MWISKRRLELEKKVAIQDVLLRIIKLSNAKNKFTFTLDSNTLTGEHITKVYEISATLLSDTERSK